MQKKYKNKQNAGFRFRFVMFVVYLVLIAALLLLTIKFVGSKLMPSAIAIARAQAVGTFNSSIDKAINNAVKSYNVTSLDMIVKDTENNIFSTDTILINQICADVAVDVSKDLENMEKHSIKIPIGILTGIDIFSGLGPRLSVTLQPIGTAVVDYKTLVKEVGINQVNYQIWLEVSSVIKVVVPLLDDDIEINRRIALVDTVITGIVPDMYLIGTKIQN